jgi:hypothetical protein
MAYISSKANRFYTVRESSFGQVAAAGAKDRIPAVKLQARQQMRTAERKDKTGSRTFVGLPPGGRRRTQFELRTYMTSWGNTGEAPAYGPMFEGCLGAAPLLSPGAAAGNGSNGNTLVFAAPHNLAPGQAVTFNGDMRFVEAIPNDTTVIVNAPFSTAPAWGAAIGATCTYFPATELPSTTIFDYWSPSTAVQRILCGAAVNRMEVKVNGDFHEFLFSGLAQDLLDSSSFTAGLGALSSFPEEPPLESFDYTIIPGHMGQAWLGSMPSQFHTVTNATFTLDNDLDLRAKEFGSNVPKCISPGNRSVKVDFELYGLDDEATKELYQAARQGSPVSVMFQLGEQEGQLMGVYLKSVVPEVPEFEDSEARLRWRFSGSRAQGTADDEIAVAFG